MKKEPQIGKYIDDEEKELVEAILGLGAWSPTERKRTLTINPLSNKSIHRQFSL